MLLFLDESGTDHRASPYEVTGGIAIAESDLWPFIQAVAQIQQECFGGALKQLAPDHEFKGKSLLARDKFKYAGQADAMPDARRQEYARRFLEQRVTGHRPRMQEFTAYGQACLAYVERLLKLCADYTMSVFASIVEPDAPTSQNPDVLRRDLAFLFERYAYYIAELQSHPTDPQPHAIGLLVFDELERVQCRRLLDRMHSYFVRTQRGSDWGELIIPEPFFVHSDLTTGTQVADIIVYVLNWAYRFGAMGGAVRHELLPYAEQIRATLLYRTQRCDDGGKKWPVSSITYVDDLRGAQERRHCCDTE